MTPQEAITYFKKRILDDHGYPINKEHCETALKALYKANKLRPILYDKHYFKCPYCKEDLGTDEDDIYVYDVRTPNYCHNCGQALDWSAELKSENKILKDSNINLQGLYEAEKERVAKAKEKCIGIAKALKTAKAEAAKEFAERLKAEYADFDEKYEIILPQNIHKAIDGILKETVGVSNADK